MVTAGPTARLAWEVGAPPAVRRPMNAGLDRCEVCGSENLLEIGRRVYRRADAARLDAWQRRRYRVFFEQWFPGLAEVALVSLCCRRCAFICYRPRPEALDVTNKYRLLIALRGPRSPRLRDSPTERQRARLLYDFVAARIPLDSVATILDFGGHDGRLLRDFVAAGKRCFTIDYDQPVVAQVTKLADTLEDVADAPSVDLILCNHVIEHVADPLAVVRRLKERLRPGGWLFVEVPMEIWRTAPLGTDPVTHINFFTPRALRNLLEIAGFGVRVSRLRATFHASGKWRGVRCGGQQRSRYRIRRRPAIVRRGSLPASEPRATRLGPPAPVAKLAPMFALPRIAEPAHQGSATSRIRRLAILSRLIAHRTLSPGCSSSIAALRLAACRSASPSGRQDRR